MPLNDIVRQRLQPLTSAFTANRIFLYAVFSTFATAATIANACRAYSNFYSVSVYLSRSGRSLLVLANFGTLLALLSGRILQRIFFGPLQAREVERLYDQTWMFVTESLLAFTIFRDDFDIPFVVMFGFLLFIKCFHWLIADRVESIDQVPYPGPPVLFHIRLGALFCILWAVDFGMFLFAVESTLANGVGGTVLFASEYAILMASALNSLARYGLTAIELRRASTRGGANAPAWENKSMYIFYIELVTDFLKLTTYLTFFMVVLTFYGLPLNIIRDVYLTARSFITRLRALVRYHNATRDMDRRYPNATEEELAAMSDRTCIICREEMIAPANNQNPPAAANNANNANQAQDGPNVTPKKLPCGHIFHFQCLRSWLERQQSCPTCRRTVLETDQPNRGAAQAGARGARQPAPQPNAAPQPPQPGQPGQPAANGAIGWLGRMMGVALQPPPAPGQPPNGQLAPGFIPVGPPGFQQMPGNPGWPAPGQQFPPPGYLYPYPYHMPPPLPPQQLQPPPVYRGFYGPGNVWHPWGVDQPPAQPQAPGPSAETPRQEGQPAPEPTRTATSAASDSAASGPNQAQGAVPTRTLPETAREQAPRSEPAAASRSATAPPSTANLEEDRAMTPREAAALAALRRTGGSRTTAGGGAAEGRPSTDAVVNNAAPAADNGPAETVSHAPTSGNSGPASSSAPGGESADPAPALQQQPAAAADPRPQVPPLIPLYDLTALQHYGVLPANAPAPAYYQAQLAQRFPYRAPGQPPQGLRPPAQAGSAPPPRYRPAAARAPLAQLPPTLTDEQIARMDRLTRDAIDERLRVLEGVSSAVYRCVEELTRIRSVLPPREDAAPAGPSATAPEQGAPSTAAHADAVPPAADPDPSAPAPTKEQPVSAKAWAAQLEEAGPSSAVEGQAQGEDADPRSSSSSAPGA